MRILLLASDTQAARDLHSKLLSYRGIYWDLKHFTRVERALAALDSESFDVALVKLRGDESVDDEELAPLLGAIQKIPLVAMIDSEHAEHEERWIQLGIADVLATDILTTSYLMRRLRLAAARFERQRTEYRHAVNKLVYQRSTAVVHAATSSHGPIETEWIHRSRDLDAPLSVALLKERGTSRLLESAEGAATIEVFRNLQDYYQALEASPHQFDLAIVEQELFDREGAQEFDRERFGFPAPPMLLIASDRSDVSAVTNVLNGFDDCIPHQSASTNTMLRYMRMSLARWEYGRSIVSESLQNAPNISERRNVPREGSDRRSETRYLLTRAMLAIPILPDGAPDQDNVCEAFSLDFSMEGVGFQIANQASIPARNWVVGVEHNPSDGRGSRFFFSHVTVQSASYVPGGVRLGAVFVPAGASILRPDNLQPRMNAENGRFSPRMPQSAIAQWVNMGFMFPRLLHRIQCCPECAGTVTLGRGCCECGSPDIRFQERVHQFSCGTCEHTNGTVSQVGTCLSCRLRFPADLAIEKEVFGYEIDRLDVLAILNG